MLGAAAAVSSRWRYGRRGSRQHFGARKTSPRHRTCFQQGRMGYGVSMADASMGSPEKDPEDWVTGDEPMTGPQRSYLETLAREAGEHLPADMTKAQASELIDRLQEKTGRGR
jgi:hypothetical protein